MRFNIVQEKLLNQRERQVNFMVMLLLHILKSVKVGVNILDFVSHLDPQYERVFHYEVDF